MSLRQAASGLADRLREALSAVPSASALAARWRRRADLGGPEARLSAMVRHELAKAFALGAATGAGVSFAPALGLPGARVVAALFQARLVGAIASLRGYDLDAPDIEARVLACVVGAAANGGAVGGQAAEAVAHRAVLRAGARGLGRLREAGGRGAPAAAARRGKAALAARALPVWGALVGGGVDLLDARRAVARARHAFPPRPGALTRR